MMENIVLAAVEGGCTHGKLYTQLRTILMDDPTLKPLLPQFIRTSRDLNHFWSYIKGVAPQ